jgi:rubrerythrin
MKQTETQLVKDMVAFIHRVTKSNEASPIMKVNAQRLLDRLVTWHCIRCGIEVPKNDRCKICGKTKREKS